MESVISEESLKNSLSSRVGRGYGLAQSFLSSPQRDNGYDISRLYGRQPCLWRYG